MLYSVYAAYGVAGLYGDNCGSLKITEAVPQTFTEPLSLLEIKTYLNVDEPAPPDPGSLEQVELEDMITAAREIAEIIQGRDLIQKQYDLAYDYFPGYEIRLRHPLVSVDLMTRKDSSGVLTAMVENVDFIVDKAKKPGIITPLYGMTWPSFTPWPTSAILIRFTSGYAPDSPFWLNSGARIKNGMKLLISHWYNKKLPFEKGITPGSEYAYAVTQCFGMGGMTTVF